MITSFGHRKVRAAKPHYCTSCRSVIRVGDHYHRAVVVFLGGQYFGGHYDDQMVTSRRCLVCGDGREPVAVDAASLVPGRVLTLHEELS